MKIVIIGSKGFIGSNCRDYFIEQGHEVIGCDIIDCEELNYFSIEKIENNFSVLFSKGDIDYCINAAGSANVSYSFQFPEKDFELNVSLIINILAAIKTNCVNCKFINFSSAAVYGNPNQLPIKEDSEVKPLSPYGYHKLLSEKLLTEYHRFFNLKTCSLRVFSAFGPGLRKQLFWDIYQKTLLHESVNLFGTGEESRDFIYISDLVKAVECIMTNAEFRGETINIASGTETTIENAASVFLKSLHVNKKLIFNGEGKSGDPKNWRADISLLQKFGFNPDVNINSGIEKYAFWLNNNKVT
jgi:UDP-glucose 4-epimerase